MVHEREMRFLNAFQDRIEIGSRLYFHCRKCSSIFMCEDYLNNPVFSTRSCYCGYYGHGYCFEKGKKEELTQDGEKHRSGIGIPTQNEYEDATIISRLACIVAKEEPMQRMLRLIQKHRHGIPTKELVQNYKWMSLSTDIDKPSNLFWINLGNKCGRV